MKITASVPTFNSKDTLEETLLSLLNQSYPFDQIKVYDNQSTDETREIVQKLMGTHSNLILIVNEVNLGAEGNFSKCIKEATGDLTILAHADDIYHADFNKMMVELFYRNPNLAAAFCSANEINERGEIIGQRFVPNELRCKSEILLNKNEATKLFYKYGNFVTCPSVVVKSEIYREKIKVWDGENFKSSADLDVWIRLLDFGNLGFLNHYLINYRVAMASYSFRIAKIRTTKHDIFKVLESKNNQELANQYASNLHFLLNKDCANRFLNILRTKDNEKIKSFKWDEQFHLTDVVFVGFQSIWHFKMFLAILGLRVMYLLKGFV